MTDKGRGVLYSAYAIIWAATIIIAANLYQWGAVMRSSRQLCSISGIGTQLGALIAPHNWLGILAALLTIAALYKISRYLLELPGVSPYRPVALLLVIFLICLQFALGCS